MSGSLSGNVVGTATASFSIIEGAGVRVVGASENLFDSNAQTCHDVVRYSTRPGVAKMSGIMNFLVVPKTVL